MPRHYTKIDSRVAGSKSAFSKTRMTKKSKKTRSGKKKKLPKAFTRG